MSDLLRDLHAVITAREPLIVTRRVLDERGRPIRDIPRGRTYVTPHPMNRKEPPRND